MYGNELGLNPLKEGSRFCGNTGDEYAEIVKKTALQAAAKYAHLHVGGALHRVLWGMEIEPARCSNACPPAVFPGNAELSVQSGHRRGGLGGLGWASS